MFIVGRFLGAKSLYMQPTMNMLCVFFAAALWQLADISECQALNDKKDRRTSINTMKILASGDWTDPWQGSDSATSRSLRLL